MNLSLLELGVLCDANKSLLSRIERGQRGVSDSMKVRLAKALDRDPTELFPLSLDKAA